MVSIFSLLKLRRDLLSVDWLSKGYVVFGQNRACRVNGVCDLLVVTIAVDIYHLVLHNVINVLVNI